MITYNMWSDFENDLHNYSNYRKNSSQLAVEFWLFVLLSILSIPLDIILLPIEIIYLLTVYIIERIMGRR